MTREWMCYTLCSNDEIYQCKNNDEIFLKNHQNFLHNNYTIKMRILNRKKEA